MQNAADNAGNDEEAGVLGSLRGRRRQFIQ
jgi:hypothetical protein